MRVGMILDKAFPPDPRVENESIFLIKEGYELFLFCLTFSKEEEGISIYKGMKVVRHFCSSFLYRMSALTYTIPYYSFLMARKIEKFATLYKIDLFHVHDIQIISAAYRVSRKKDLPCILDLHENRPEIMKFYPYLNGLGRYFIHLKNWKRAEKKYSLLSQKVIVVTKYAKRELLKNVNCPSSKVVVLPNTVSRDFYQNHEMKNSILDRYRDQFTLLYIGDTSLRRGLLTAISSIPFLKNMIVNLKLVIVGKSREDPFLKMQVKKLKIEEYVDFEGWKDEKYLPSYIISSRVCIIPIHRNAHHDTTYANKLFQYLSFGKPVLVSDATAQKKIVEKNDVGLVHESGSPESFCEGVMKFYKNPLLMEEKGKKGAEFIEKKFSWEKKSEALFKIYKEIEKK